MNKVGKKRDHHLAAAQPDLYVRRGFHGVRSYRIFRLLSLHVRSLSPRQFYLPLYIRDLYCAELSLIGQVPDALMCDAEFAPRLPDERGCDGRHDAASRAASPSRSCSRDSARQHGYDLFTVALRSRAIQNALLRATSRAVYGGESIVDLFQWPLLFGAITCSGSFRFPSPRTFAVASR